MSIDEITNYRDRIEECYTSRRKSLRAFSKGRRKADTKRLSNFFDVPLIIMFLLLVIAGGIVAFYD